LHGRSAPPDWIGPFCYIFRVSEFTIRRAVEDDAPAIQQCLQTAFAPFDLNYSREAFLDTVPTLENVHQRFTYMTLFVAVDTTKAVIGTVGCHLKSPEEGHIRGMAVLAEWQGKGVAQQLLAAAESEIRGRGCRRVSLDTTDPLKRAFHFYEKQGYRRTGRVDDFFGMPLHEFVKDLS
jgi:N-acetylglutamate synthase-like GNAT family acetyltransferase